MRQRIFRCKEFYKPSRPKGHGPPARKWCILIGMIDALTPAEPVIIGCLKYLAITTAPFIGCLASHLSLYLQSLACDKSANSQDMGQQTRWNKYYVKLFHEPQKRGCGKSNKAFNIAQPMVPGSSHRKREVTCRYGYPPTRRLR